MSNPLLKYLFTAVVSAGVLSLDQASKLFVHTQVERGAPIVLIEGFFNISYVRNPGGIFGLFGESPDLVRLILFVFFPLLCVVIIFMMLRETQNRFQVMALAFILGGAAGNYIDRIRLKYVIDFIDWHFRGWHWPTFNFADSFIVIGLCILFYFHIKETRQSKAKSQ